MARACYWTPHLWSKAHPLWEEVQSHSSGLGTKMVSSLDVILNDTQYLEAKLIVVDPKTILNREAVLKLISLAQSGRVVALSRSPLFTESARFELENACFGARKLDIDLGLSYRLHVLGSGRLVLFDLPAQTPTAAAFKTFAKALFAIAEVEAVFDKPTPGLETICMQKRLGGIGLFVLNSQNERVGGELSLREDAVISDLGRALAGVSSSAQGKSLETRILPLEVSPLGVVPLSLDFPLAGESQQSDRLSNSVVDPLAPLATQMDQNGIDLRLV